MAQKVTVALEDDLTGGPADQKVRFAVEGTGYEIDLSAKNGIHDFVFDGAYSGFRLEADGGGGTQKQKIDLKPGTYTFYCTYPGHRQAGMQGTLTVK